jgi:hypothetical protein
VKGFRFYRGSINAFSHRKGKSSLTLHSTSVHACDLFSIARNVSTRHVTAIVRLLRLGANYLTRWFQAPSKQRNLFTSLIHGFIPINLSIPIDFNRTLSIGIPNGADVCKFCAVGIAVGHPSAYIRSTDWPSAGSYISEFYRSVKCLVKIFDCRNFRCGAVRLHLRPHN